MSNEYGRGYADGFEAEKRKVLGQLEAARFAVETRQMTPESEMNPKRHVLSLLDALIADFKDHKWEDD